MNQTMEETKKYIQRKNIFFSWWGYTTTHSFQEILMTFLYKCIRIKITEQIIEIKRQKKRRNTEKNMVFAWCVYTTTHSFQEISMTFLYKCIRIKITERIKRQKKRRNTEKKTWFLRGVGTLLYTHFRRVLLNIPT